MHRPTRTARATTCAERAPTGDLASSLFYLIGRINDAHVAGDLSG